MKLPALPTRRPKSDQPAPVKKAKAFPGVIRLSLDALKDWRSGWERFTWIVAIIAVPLQLIDLLAGSSSNLSASTYNYVAIFLLNASVLWAVILFGRTGRAPRAAVAYYEGSAIIVRLLAVLLLVVLMLIPLTIGLALYLAGATSLASAGESLIILFVALLIALPSLHMLIRFGLAFYVTADTDLRPIAALRTARALTLGKYWGITRRYLGLLLFMLILAVPAGIISSLLTYFGQPALGNFIFGLITTIILLPIFDLYLLRMYRSLQPKTATADAA